jgi:hypothetical protein
LALFDIEYVICDIGEGYVVCGVGEH